MRSEIKGGTLGFGVELQLCVEGLPRAGGDKALQLCGGSRFQQGSRRRQGNDAAAHGIPDGELAVFFLVVQASVAVPSLDYLAAAEGADPPKE